MADLPNLSAFHSYMQQFISEERLALMDRVINQRTRHITVVLEDIYQPHNASAIVRNCDCFGVQDLHVVEATNEFQPNADVAMGSGKWVSLQNHATIDDCVTTMKNQGYRIAATSLRPGAVSIYDLPVDAKVALFFGAEEHGLSAAAHDAADYFVQIPMVGFTQSFNVSVSAALCLSELTHRLRRAELDWQLSDHEKLQLLTRWYLSSVRDGDAIMKRFCQDQEISPKELESLILCN